MSAEDKQAKAFSIGISALLASVSVIYTSKIIFLNPGCLQYGRTPAARYSRFSQ